MSKNKSITGFLHGLLFSLFALLLFVTPILFTTNTNELFEFPKMYFVYLLGSLIIYLFILAKIFKGFQLKPFNYLIGLFLLVYLLSTVFSSHLYTSVWGYYTRFNGGLVSVMLFVGLYYVAKNIFDHKDFLNLYLISALGLVPVGIYACLQKFGMTGLSWEQDAQVRVFSTFGQPNWLAAYLVMFLPGIVYLLLKSPEDRRDRNSFFVYHNSLGGVLRYKFERAIPIIAKPLMNYLSFLSNNIFWFGMYLIGFSALWFTQSLSGLLGFFAGVTYVLVFSIKNLRTNLNKLIVLLIITLGVAFIFQGIYVEKIYSVFLDIRKIVVLDVFAEEPLRTTAEQNVAQGVQAQIADPAYIRGELWKSTLRLIKSSPKVFWLGTGPETFPYAFQPFRSESLNFSSEWNYIFNKPHNYYLELWSQIGFIGLGLHILLLLWALKKNHPLYTSGIIGLAITNIFGWPTVMTSLLFWVFLSALDD